MITGDVGGIIISNNNSSSLFARRDGGLFPNILSFINIES